ncbi:MAG TPA: imelysin family protein [Polyangiaceae bacterium]|nr:imelysin family protein [Polyangiaceae bacterium]
MVARFSLGARWALAGALALSSGACRKPAPDEVVYTGRTMAPKTPPVPPVGTGGTGGAGGSTTSGSGGTGGAGAGGRAGDAGAGGSGGASGADPTTPFSKAALLAAVADCALDRYREFRDVAALLDDKARASASSGMAPELAAVREAWLVAMKKWQEVELFRFGPMARSTDPGGKDLRDQIDGWPLVSRCAIEERLVSQAYGDPDFGMSLINVRGLAAFEYAAFYEGSDNACSAFSTINAHGTWAALGADEIVRRKAGYAAAVSRDVLTHANEVVARWAPTEGNFRAELVGAGQQSATYASEQKALNAVSDALFFIEQEAKDWKLGRPLGLGDCANPTCPEAVESPYARQSTAHLRQNLAGFRMLFQGCSAGNGGFGFDDWLRAVDASDLADRMLAVLSRAEEAVDGLDPPLEQALATDPPKLMAVYTAFKGLTDLLKTEFVTVLNLELPKSTQGDND